MAAGAEPGTPPSFGTPGGTWGKPRALEAGPSRLLVPHGVDIPVQILREHVMVRVGGGWDTLEHYLDKHDPCRCTSLCECPCPQTPRLGEEGRGRDPSRSRCFSGTFSRAATFGTAMPRCFAGNCRVLGTFFGFGGH